MAGPTDETLSRLPLGPVKPTPKPAGRRYDKSTLLFLGVPGLLMAVFLVYPTIYTIALSFNRGRRGEFTEWVGFQHYINLLTGDKSFLDVTTFPPEGAIWNNLLWAVFYTSLVIFLGLIVAVLASRVRYELAVKAVVFLPMAIAATALAIIWNFVYAPDANIGLLNAILDPHHGARDLVARQSVPRECRADRRRCVGFGRVRDGHPVRGIEEHPERDPRGGAGRRGE